MNWIANNRRTVGLLALAFFAVTSFSVCFFGLKVLRQFMSSDWPSADGQVLRVRYQEFVSRDGSRLAHLQFDYQYTVAGRIYHSGDFYAGVITCKGDPIKLQKLARQYPQGAFIPVYYDPNNPKTAVLRRGILWTDALLLTCATVLLVCAADIIRKWVKKWGNPFTLRSFKAVKLQL